jgi:uncharacterized protein (DUF2461 family)
MLDFKSFFSFHPYETGKTMEWFSQNKGRFLLVVATPYMKLIWPDLRTKQCCHEHAGEIFTVDPATCETNKNFVR